jgi:uncharacterized RDD family membrane protein YckC
MQTPNSAGFWHRYFAAIVDFGIKGFMFVLPLFLVSLALSSTEVTNLNPYLNIGIIFLAGILFFGPISLLYKTFFTYKYGGTIGKLINGLRIVDNTSLNFIDKQRALNRSMLGYTFSNVFFGYGYLYIFRNAEKRAYHDVLFDTRVISKGFNIGGVLLSIVFILTPVVLTALTIANIVNSLII